MKTPTPLRPVEIAQAAMKEGLLSRLGEVPEIIRAHQYLYYVRGLPVLSDYDYDKLCERLDVFGGGGSDRAADYSAEVIVLAATLRAPVKLPAEANISKAPLPPKKPRQKRPDPKNRKWITKKEIQARGYQLP